MSLNVIKLYKGSIDSILDTYGRNRKVFNAYRDLLLLKAVYKRSYITNYKSKLKEVASVLGVSDRTVRRKIHLWSSLGMVSFEKNTLRLISNTEIRELHSRRERLKLVGRSVRAWAYIEVVEKDLESAMILAPIEDNIKRQERAVHLNKLKSSRGTNTTRRDSDWKLMRSANPNHEYSVNEDIFISQKKAAELTGYRSGKSGFEALKRLRASGNIEVCENIVEISEDYYWQVKRSPKKTRAKCVFTGGKNSYLYCLPNTVKVTKSFDSSKYRLETGIDKIPPYSVTSYTFLSNY